MKHQPILTGDRIRDQISVNVHEEIHQEIEVDTRSNDQGVDDLKELPDHKEGNEMQACKTAKARKVGRLNVDELTKSDLHLEEKTTKQADKADQSLEDEKAEMWWHSIVAGGLSGVMSRTLTAPLDRLKSLFQVQGSDKKEKLTIRGGFTHMIKEEGFRSMWRGNGINIVKTAPRMAAKFWIYEQLKPEDKDPGIVKSFAVGACAGLISQALIYPMEVLKTRIAISKTGQYKGFVDLVRQLYKTEGIRVFAAGFVPEMIGVVPFAGIELGLYETLRRLHIKKHEGNKPSTTVDTVYGITGSICAVAATYPFALVRTQMQTHAASNMGMNATFKYIYQSQGFKGLYRGVTLNVMKMAPVAAITYYTYRAVNNFFASNNGTHKK